MAKDLIRKRRKLDWVFVNFVTFFLNVEFALFLLFLKDRFQKFAGKDNQLNIDEYLGMVKDRLEAEDALRKSKYDAPPAQTNNAKNSVDAPKRASEIKSKAEKNN